MRHPLFTTVLPFLADELAAKGGIDIHTCTCPPGGPCLGTEDEPLTILIFDVMNRDEDDNGSGSAPQPGDDDFDEDLDDDLDDDGDDEDIFSFELTDSAIEAIEREQDRQDVAHLGKIVDNMVYIVGMYSALVQNKVGA